MVAYRDTDRGDFVFVLCKKGLEKALNRRLKCRERVVLDVDIKEVDE